MGIHATAPSGSTSLADGKQTIPIVLVPGIMGTRLARRKNDRIVAAWDPPTQGLGWQGLKNCASSEDDLTRNIVCFPDNGYTASVEDIQGGYGAFAGQIGHFAKGAGGAVDPTQSWGTCFEVLPCYYPTVFALADLLPQSSYLDGVGCSPRVYCAGYDFRGDNRISAQRLQKIVDAALVECAAEKAILVCHSMGGLVARCYARQHPDKVQAIFLIGSPSLGAVEPYVYLRDFQDLQLGFALSLSWERFLGAAASSEKMFGGARSFSRYNMPSLYQLCASDCFALAAGDDDWLQFSDEAAAASADPTTSESQRAAEDAGLAGLYAPTDCSNVNLLYRNGLTGFIDYDDNEWQLQSQYLESAVNFHDADLAVSESSGTLRLDGPSDFRNKPLAWMHPRTYIAYSQQHETLTGGIIRDDGTLEVVKGKGDARVPLCSAYCADEVVSTPILDRYEITSDEEHQYLPAAAGTISWLKEKIAMECLQLVKL